MGSPVNWLTDSEYAAAPIQEKALAWADHFATLKVQEIGANRGPWVVRFLASVGLGPGYPWCASFANYCLEQAGFTGGPTKGRGAVRNWAAWGRQTARTFVVPMRGDLFYWLNPDGTGHIGLVCNVGKDGTIATCEGNTDAGGSREGDGVYKRTRIISDKMHFIRWWK